MDMVFFMSLMVWSITSFARRNIYYFYGYNHPGEKFLGKHIMPASGAYFDTVQNASIHSFLDALRLIYIGSLVFTLMAGVLFGGQIIFDTAPDDAFQMQKAATTQEAAGTL